jgi:hypothetical protein
MDGSTSSRLDARLRRATTNTMSMEQITSRKHPKISNNPTLSMDQ